VVAYLGRSGSLPLRRMLTGVLQVALFLDARASGAALTLPAGFEDVTAGLPDLS
jgi:hypothetical protein